MEEKDRTADGSVVGLAAATGAHADAVSEVHPGFVYRKYYTIQFPLLSENESCD